MGIDEDSLAGKYLIVPLRLVCEESSDSFVLTLSLLQNGDQPRNYTASLEIPNGEYTTAVFDISNFTSSKSGADISLQLSVDTPKGKGGTLLIDEILTGKEPDNAVVTVIVIVGIVLVAGALMAVFVVWFRKHYTIDFGNDKKDKKKEKKENKEK